MIIDNNISPLPFYNSLSEQHAYKPYAFGAVFPLMTWQNWILPFQFVTDRTDDNYHFTKAILHRVADGHTDDITASMLANGLTHLEHQTPSQVNYGLAIYYAEAPISINLQEGLYYIELELSDSDQVYAETYYSEIFVSKSDMQHAIEIEYGNDTSLELAFGMVEFGKFKFKLYVDALIGKPEYQFEETSVQRMGYTYIESQVSKKVYNFGFVAPEYLCDALRILRICNNRTVKAVGKSHNVADLDLTIDWQEQGDLAEVSVSFDTCNVVANLGGYDAPHIAGDFNNDFNKDYKQS